MDRVPAEPVVTRHGQLREATLASHAALDAAVGSFGSLREYSRYLSAMAAFRAPVEATLAASGDIAPSGMTLPPTLSPALSADMADLGVPPATTGSASLAPLVKSPSGVAGALYVLEGSAVGARILVRRAAALGLDATHGARHLVAQASDRARWPRFLLALERVPAFDLDAAISAATAVFASASSAFREVRDDAA